MAKFKLNISNPETGKCQTVEVEGPRAQPLVGRRLGEVVDGSIAGLPKVGLQIVGGSDKDGTPMRADVHGGVKAAVILSRGPGFRPRLKGERRRKLVRGNVITEDTVQINMKVVGERRAT